MSIHDSKTTYIENRSECRYELLKVSFPVLVWWNILH